MAVFSIASLMAVNLFIIFVQQQRRALNQQELQNDSRAVIEEIAKDLREGSVDYAYYEQTFSGSQQKLFIPLSSQATDITLRDNCLVIRDTLNTQILYRLNGKVVQRLVPTTPIVSPNTCNTFTALFQDISPTTLEVSSFTFLISPSEDPFAGQSALQCDTITTGVPNDTACQSRWGTTCAVPLTTTCINARGTNCYCYPQKYGTVAPLHPQVTFSLNASRTSNKLTVSQVFQTTVASRIFKNLDRLNSYVP